MKTLHERSWLSLLGASALALASGCGTEPQAPEPVPEVLDDPALRRAAKAAHLRDYVGFGFPDRP